jgi:ABC-type nickel/cobalt efflux system permease component RcnA
MLGFIKYMTRAHPTLTTVVLFIILASGCLLFYKILKSDIKEYRRLQKKKKEHAEEKKQK